MTRLNYQRQALYQRAKESAHRYPEEIQRTTPYHNFWIGIPFKRYRGMTLPQLIFCNLSYFYWLRDRQLYGPLKEQTAMVAFRAAHILPPADRKSSKFCLVRNDSGQLARIMLIDKRRRAPSNEGDIYCSPHLDLAVFRQFSRQSDAVRKISRFLRRTYFGSPEATATALRCQEFFDDPRHFDIDCDEDHSELD